ncbi:unnamed protein product [Closterium sp. NIES-54]
MSGPLLLVRGAAAARARVAGVVAGAARVVVGAAVEVVGAGEVVAVVGVVAGVGALVAAVEAAVGVAVVAAVGVVAVGLELRVEVLEKARGSSSFVSGLFSVGRLGSASAGSDFYLCVPPYPGIEAAALGASESIIPSTAPAEALHTFTLDSGASRCFFRDSTTLTPLSTPVPVTLADPSGAPVLARSSTVLLCPVVSASPPAAACVEGRKRAAPHSSSFCPTTAPLQTLHMDVWGPDCVSGQGRERYFLLVVDDYTRYTTVFPLRTKGQVVDVLIPWIRTLWLQLRERFHTDLPVLHLHSDRGGEFSSDLLRDIK